MKKETSDLLVAQGSAITGNEFAIEQHAKFDLLQGSKIKLNEDGTIVVTYKLRTMEQLVPGPANVTFGVYGVFQKNTTENFVRGNIPTELSLETTNTEVLLTAPGDTINVVTDGDKRESGQGIRARNNTAQD